MSGIDDGIGGAEPPAVTLGRPELTGITRMSAADTVRARIALAIELDLIGAGERLPSDRQIAEALDVSEMTVRRTLEAMAEDGVVERRRGRSGGTFATGSTGRLADSAAQAYRADAHEVHRLIDLRTLLECAVTHHAAVNATLEQLAAMTEHVEAAAHASDWTGYHAADARFHRSVAAASGLAWAQEPYTEVLDQLYRYFIPYPIDRLRSANEDHLRIVAALSARDAVTAVDVMRTHIQDLHRTMFIGSPRGA